MEARLVEILTLEFLPLPSKIMFSSDFPKVQQNPCLSFLRLSDQKFDKLEKIFDVEIFSRVEKLALSEISGRIRFMKIFDVSINSRNEGVIE